MDKQQATQFINNLFTEVWTNLDETKISKYYHSNVSVDFNQQNANYDDIVNRLNYIKNNYSKIENQINTILAEDNRIAVYLNQTYYKLLPADFITYQIIFIYELEGLKVSKIHAVSDPKFNYFEK